jgi:hypothetical protein
VLAAYIGQEAVNAAAAVYCGTSVLICLAYNLLWHSAALNRRLVESQVSQTHIDTIRRAYAIALTSLGLISTPRRADATQALAEAHTSGPY